MALRDGVEATDADACFPRFAVADIVGPDGERCEAG